MHIDTLYGSLTVPQATVNIHLLFHTDVFFEPGHRGGHYKTLILLGGVLHISISTDLLYRALEEDTSGGFLSVPQVGQFEDN